MLVGLGRSAPESSDPASAEDQEQSTPIKIKFKNAINKAMKRVKKKAKKEELKTPGPAQKATRTKQNASAADRGQSHLEGHFPSSRSPSPRRRLRPKLLAPHHNEDL